MKNLFFSMLFLLSLIFFLASITEAAIPCNTVDTKAAACLGYATGKAKAPTPKCCSDLEQLAQSVKSVGDKKDICRCLKGAYKSLGVQDKYLSQIPGICKINVGFRVSTTIDCEAIH